MCGIGDSVELARRVRHVHRMHEKTDHQRDEQPVLEGFGAPIPAAEVSHPSTEEKQRRNHLRRPRYPEFGIIRRWKGNEPEHEKNAKRQGKGRKVDRELINVGSLRITFVRPEKHAPEKEQRQEKPRGRPGPRGHVRALEPRRPRPEERGGHDGVVPIQQSGAQEARANEQESSLFLAVVTDERKARDDQGHRGADKLPDDVASRVVIDGEAPEDVECEE